MKLNEITVLTGFNRTQIPNDIVEEFGDKLTFRDPLSFQTIDDFNGIGVLLMNKMSPLTDRHRIRNILNSRGPKTRGAQSVMIREVADVTEAVERLRVILSEIKTIQSRINRNQKKELAIT